MPDSFNRNPVLSIITPVMNAQKDLEEFFQAVIDQRCSEIEHILVDGASQDATVEIIKKYAQQYKHIRWISKKDKGPAEAINNGLALARGEFIGILCLNDYYEPGTLNEVVTLLPSLPQPSFLVGNCTVWNEKGEIFYHNKPQAFKSSAILLGKQFPHNPAAYFYRKALHEKVGLYNADDNYATDLDFLLRAFSAAKVHYVDKTWGNFRMLPGGNTYETTKSGQLRHIALRAKIRYIKTLPIIPRLFFEAYYKFPKLKSKYFLGRIKHYIKNPVDIWTFFKKRIFSDQKGASLNS